jgi:hypothetical protein
MKKLQFLTVFAVAGLDMSFVPAANIEVIWQNPTCDCFIAKLPEDFAGGSGQTLFRTSACAT